MGADSFKELIRHIGHNIVCVTYNGDTLDDIRNVALECEDCNEVLLDYDAIPFCKVCKEYFEDDDLARDCCDKCLEEK